MSYFYRLSLVIMKSLECLIFVDIMISYKILKELKIFLNIISIKWWKFLILKMSQRNSWLKWKKQRGKNNKKLKEKEKEDKKEDKKVDKKEEKRVKNDWINVIKI